MADDTFRLRPGKLTLGELKWLMKEPRAIVTAPRAPGEEHRERDERRALHQRAASSRVRPYQGASGKVMGRIAGSVTPAFR